MPWPLQDAMVYSSQTAVVATFLHWAAAVLAVLATQMNSVLARWAVSRCLRMLAQVTIKSLSGRTVLNPLLAPVMSLAASVVAEPSVVTALSCIRMRSTEGNRTVTELASPYVVSGDYQPPHL